MEIFRIFGSIFLQDNEVNRTLNEVDENARGVSGTFADMVGAIGKWGAAAGLAIGAVAVAMGTKAVNASSDLQKSLNGLQAQTGKSDESMQGMRDAMLDIYNNNFGEDFADIGKQMAVIAQQAVMSKEELAATTKNAIALRDTFEFEVNESFRSAKMLMDQFGISSEEAYNLIAQGAQYGLDKNGDLLDTINEYGVHFQQLGFSSDEMFNSLVNGARSGTFSVDKLGDAVKEFGIRSKDGSTTSKDAFKALGLDANKLTLEFAKGGISARKSFEIVTEKLAALKDPVAQSAAGVALFGTQWEDLGKEGVIALSDMSGEIDRTINALGDINAVKYNTFGEAMTGIGRQLETGILIPLGDKILPILNVFATWISTNMPEIQEYFATTMSGIDSGITTVTDAFNVYLLPSIMAFWAWVQPQLPQIQAMFETTFATIENVIAVVIEITKSLITAFTEWYTSNQTTLTNIKDNFVTIFALIVSIVTSFITLTKQAWDNYGKDIINIIKTAWDLVVGTVEIATTLIKDILAIFAAGLKGDWSSLWVAIKQLLQDAWGGIFGVMRLILSEVGSIFGLFGNVLKNIWIGIWSDIENGATSALNSVVDIINNLITKITNGINTAIGLVNKIPGIELGTIKAPKIPGLASGGTITESGRVLVGENAPEILDLPKGARVTPLDKTSTINNYYNIASQVIREESDIKKIAREMHNLQKRSVFG